MPDDGPDEDLGGEARSAAHLRLRREFAELEREHKALEVQNPVSIADHRAHRAKLRDFLARLNEHVNSGKKR